MGGEYPVSPIGSPMCQTFCGVIMMMMMMQDASRVSEVRCENLVERCVRHLEKKEMCHVLRSARKLFLHEDLWNTWFRGLSFAIKMSEGPAVRETGSELYRSQSTKCLPKGGSCFESRSGCVTEKLSMCSCNEDRQRESREERRDECFQRSEERD